MVSNKKDRYVLFTMTALCISDFKNIFSDKGKLSLIVLNINILHAKDFRKRS